MQDWHTVEIQHRRQEQQWRIQTHLRAEENKTKPKKKKALKGVGKTDDVAFYLGQHIVQIKTDKNKVLSDF